MKMHTAAPAHIDALTEVLNIVAFAAPLEFYLHADPCEPAALDARREQVRWPELRRTGRDGRRVQQVVEIQRWFVRHTAALGASERLSNTKIQLIRRRRTGRPARLDDDRL